MADPEHDMLRFVGSPAGLQAAVEFTAAETGFIPALIEKDYWCSVVLWRLFANGDCPLVFKGGTLLSKAFVTFTRLSEDLDFTLHFDVQCWTFGVRCSRSAGSVPAACPS